eukprot:7465413-Prorocentrum_lima.AAC.1
MTSSLVGSEMCIRDSLKAAVASSQFGYGHNAGTYLPLLHMRSWLAVSYTHLTLPTICSV